MPASLLFVFDDVQLERRARRVLGRLPSLYGDPIHVDRAPGLRDRRGPVHAGSFLRERRIALDCTASEFARIFAHEVFHFVWLRAGHPLRLEFERLLAAEFEGGARGELGWSAESRKQALAREDVCRRSRRWREYACESFCDTAAWLFSGTPEHDEFTLAGRHRKARRAWFQQRVATRTLSI